MATNIMDIGRYVQEGAQQGVQQGQQSVLSKLAPQYLSSEGADGDALYNQIASINPTAADNLYKMRQGRIDAQNTNRGKIATGFLNAQKTWPAQGMQSLWDKQFVPAAKRQGITLDPYDANTTPGLMQSWAEMYGPNAGKMAEPYTLAPGSKRFGPDNRVVAEVPTSPANAQVIDVPDGRGGSRKMLFDPQTRQVSPLPHPGAGGTTQFTGPDGVPTQIDSSVDPAVAASIAGNPGGWAGAADGSMAQLPPQAAGGYGYTPPKPELTPYQQVSLGLQQAAAMRAEEAANRAAAAAENSNRAAKAQGEMSLRKETTDRVKQDQSIINMYRNVDNAARNPSAAGDLSMIFAYMKMLDPGSVVREQEFANAQNAAGVPEQIRNAWNKALNGQRLNETQRRDFINQANKLAGEASNRITRNARNYQSMARDYGYNPERATGMADFSDVSGGQMRGSPQSGGIPPQAIQYLRQNPGMRQQFEQKYGVSADQYLR